MSAVELTVVEGGEVEETSEFPDCLGTPDEPEAAIPSPDELAQMGGEDEIEEGINAMPDIDWELTVMQTCQAMEQIVQSGNKLVAILVHPEAEAPFRAAWDALPEDVIPPEWKSKLPIVEDPTIPGVRVLTQRDLERQFLFQHYGPREAGGTGLIERLEEWCAQNQCPVFVRDVNFLRTVYLLELRDRIIPQIVVPTGSQLQLPRR